MKRNLSIPVLFWIFSLCFSLSFGAETAAPTGTPKAKSTKSRRHARAKAKATVASAEGAKGTRAKTAKPKPKAGDDVPDIAAKTTDTKAADAAGKSSTVVVRAAKASVRLKPSKNSRVLATVTTFTPVDVIESSGGWKKVKTADGVTGYVDANALARSAYVSTQGSAVKVRSGPGADDVALYSLKEHYPLRVVEKQGIRVRVVDSEGDGGWVGEKMLSARNYVVAKEKTITLREGAGKQFAKRFVADKGALFEVVEEKAGWLHLKYTDGDEGWASAKVVWGYLPPQ